MRVREEMGAWLTHHKYANVAEVGVCRGEFSYTLLSEWVGRLFMVDAWKHYTDPAYRDIANATQDEHEINFQKASLVAQRFRHRAQIVRGDSLEVAAQFPVGVLDVVYLDSNHTYEHVKKELAVWVPKIKPGGAIAGHDFLDAELPDGSFGVKRAVLEFFNGKFPNLLTTEAYPTWVYYL